MGKLNNHLFEVQLNWLKNREGICTSRSVQDTLRVSAPEGGAPGMWTPEHLLLSSLCCSFMDTFMYYAKKQALEVTHFECSAIARLEFINGRRHCTSINLYPVAKAATAAAVKTAKEVLLLAQGDCLVARTLDTDVFYHSVAEKDAHPVVHEQQA